MTDTDLPEDVAEMTVEQLNREVQRMDEHEQADVLTNEQERYLLDLRHELLKRASVAGPHAEYTGPQQ